MKLLSLWIVCLSISVMVHAQRGNYAMGARCMGLSGTCITVGDEYAAFNNIAGLGSLSNTSVSFASTILHEIPGLRMIGASINCPLMKGSATLNFYRFGNQLLSEHKIGMGYGRKIRIISLGIQVDYLQVRATGYGTSGRACIEVGGIVRLHSSFIVGLYVFQPLIVISRYSDGDWIPTVMKSGISFRPAEGLMLNLEYSVNMYEAHYLSAGLEYVIREIIALRTGFTLETLRSSFGFGWRSGRYSVDYAMSIHPLLGISHALAFSLKIAD